MTAVERAETRAALLREAEAIIARLHANEAEHEELLGMRAQTCKALRAAGAPIKELQDAFEVSRSRIQQVLREAEES